jgi:hypothetical protein
MRSMARALAPAALALAACTLTHPLDKYGAGGGPDASDDVGTVDDAGCAGDPQILEPTRNQDVGASMHLRVSAPACLTTMIVYLNDKDVLHVSDHTIDTFLPVPVGPNRVSVNGWAGTATAHVSESIPFDRKN